MQFEAFSKCSVLILSKTFVYSILVRIALYRPVALNLRTQEPHPALKHTVCGLEQSFSNTSNMLCNKLCSAIKQNVSSDLC